MKESAPAATLRQERERSMVAATTIAAAYYGSAAAVRERERLTALWYGDPIVRGLSKLDAAFAPRATSLERTTRLARRIAELRVLHGLCDHATALLKEIAFEPSPLAVHDTTFVPALGAMGSSAQKDALLDAARAWAVTGCYAQTELAHGSAVRDLETVAVYLPATHEFELRSPTPTACKWWVGGLGASATHAIVVARLILDDGSDKGPHPFLVPLRDPTSGALLPGMDAGDIGPKMAFAGVDNGYLRLAGGPAGGGVRVPASALLASEARVAREPVSGSLSSTTGQAEQWRGKYLPPPHAQASAYAGMLEARASIVASAHAALAHAATIAVRYAAVRRQFRGADGREHQLLDYPSHQQRLLPVVAQAWVFRCAGEVTQRLMMELRGQEGAAAAQHAKRAHLVLSALKVYMTEISSTSIEECRRACGGHGYSLASGLPQLFTTYVHLVTAEGDNWVLCQQVGRLLLRREEQQVDSDDESSDASSRLERVLEDGTGGALWANAARLLRQGCTDASARLRAIAATAAGPGGAAEALAGYVPIMFQMACALGSAICVEAAAQASQDLAKGRRAADATDIQTVLPVLQQLTDLYALTALQAALPMLVDAGTIAGAGATSTLQVGITSTCAALRPHAVPLVDGWILHDDALGSVLGEYEGDPYARMVQWAAREPINANRLTAPADTAETQSNAIVRNLQLLRRAGAAALERGLHKKQHVSQSPAAYSATSPRL